MRIAKRILLGFGIFLLAVVLLAGGTFLYLTQTDSGRGWLVSRINGFLTTPGQGGVSVGRIGAGLPGLLEVHDIALSDAEGVWLTVDQAVVRWSPLALASGLLDISLAEAVGIRVERQPVGEPEPQPQEPFSWPTLPVEVAVERLSVRDVQIAEPVVGMAAALQAGGRLAMRRSGAADISLVVERTDGTQGRIEANAGFQPDDGVLRLQVTAGEPAGGLIARALALPDLPPVSITLAGEGPISGWTGRLEASLGDATGVEADLALSQTGADYGIEASGTARVTALLDEQLRPLVGDGVDFSIAAATRGEQLVDVTRADVATPVAAVEAAATIDLGQSSVDGQAKVDLRDPALIEPFVAPASLAGVALEARFAGPLTAPEITAVMRADRIAAPQLELGGVTADVSVRPAADQPDGGFRGAVAGQLRAASMKAGPPETASLLAGELTVDLEADADTAAGQARLTRLAIDNPQLRASAKGEIDLNTLAATGDMQLAAASLAPLSALAGMPLTGAGELSATLRAGEDLRDVRAEITGTVSDLASSQAPLKTIFGARTTLTADLATEATGSHRFDVKLDAAVADLTAKGSLTPDFGRIEAEYRLAVSDLKPLSTLANTDLAGRGTVSGKVDGPTADPTVTTLLKVENAVIAQQPVGTVDGRFRVESPASAAKGRLELTAHPPGGRAQVATDFAVAKEKLTLPNLRIETGGESLTGQLAVPLSGGPIEGNLNARVRDLGNLLAFGGSQGGGAGTARLRLFGEGGLQAAEASLDFNNVQVVAGDPKAPLRIGRVTAEGRATAADPARGNLRLSVADLSSGDAKVRTLTFTMNGSERKADFTLAARGDVQGPLSVDASGTGALSENGAVAVTIARLQASVKDQRISARRPFRVAWQPERMAVNDLDLAISSGSVQANVELAPSGVSGTATVSALPLSLVRTFAPGAKATGTVSARLQFAGALPNPNGTAVVTFDKVRFADARELRPLDGRIDADWRGGQVDLRASIGGFAPQPLTADVRVPFRLAEDFSPVIPPNGAVSGSLNWQGQVEPLLLLLPLDDHRLRGMATVALGVSGTVAQPQATGYVELTGGDYENLMAGTIVDRISLRAEAQGDRIVITRLTARDGADGSLQATGHASLSGGPAEVNLVLNNFTVARRDDVTAALNADIAYSAGPRGSRVAGTITTTSVEIRLVNRLPPQVVDLEPIEKGARTASDQRDTAAKIEVPTATAPGIDLAVDISMPNQVFVRGRGLDSEWAGNFAVRGTADNPQINGALRSVRGQLQVLSNTLVLQESEIRLDKTGRSGFDVVLDIQATDKVEDLTVIVRVTGTAAAPKLSFTSEPALPQDEVLARILFGKNTAQLTPIEAVQLAAAVAELTGATGGGAGMLDLARGALGLDVLRVGSGGDETDGGGNPAATVTAGKYISKDIFVGVEQGTSPGSSAATVEIEIFPNVSVQSKITQEGGSNVGVKAEWDY